MYTDKDELNEIDIRLITIKFMKVKESNYYFRID